MERENAESKEHAGSEKKSEPHSENFQTIKASLPILSLIKGLYDACGMPMYGPAATSELPELPQWAKNICEQLRLTIRLDDALGSAGIVKNLVPNLVLEFRSCPVGGSSNNRPTPLLAAEHFRFESEYCHFPTSRSPLPL
jgi:hypothetical protein